jgi:FtsZ-interacting cell division protein ZipA
MKLIFIILVLLVTVIAIAFWKDIKEMSARQRKTRKKEMKPAEERVKSSGNRK